MARELSLHLFTSGTLESGGVEVPVPFFVIRHPDGDVVVDGGNPLPVAEDTAGYWGAIAEHFVVRFTPDQHCIAQLAAAGIDAAGIRHVVQTHLHCDHTGALGHFPGATVVVHERELEAARAAGPDSLGYVAADLDHPDLDWQTYTGDHDLFGDGAVRMIETPGHAAGHVSVLIALPQTGPVLLTADATDNRAIFEGRAHPRAYFSRELGNASVKRLNDVASETGAVLIFGHDAQDWAGHPARYA